MSGVSIRSNDSDSAWRRSLIWKQVYDLLPIMMIVIAALVVGIVVINATAINPETWKSLVTPLCTVIGCALSFALPLLSFVNEFENGTNRYLRQMPIPLKKIGVTKLTVALAAFLLFIGIELAVLLLASLSSSLSLSESANAVFKFSLTMSALSFSSAVISSTQTRSFISAVILGAVYCAIGFCVAIFFRQTLFDPSAQFIGGLDIFDWLVLLVSLIFLVIGFWSSARWLDTNPDTSRKELWFPKIARPEFLAKHDGLRWQRFSAFLWQSFHQQKTWLAVAAMSLLLAAAVCVVKKNEYIVLELGVLVCAWILGLTCIEADKQRDQFRFFQQYGASSALFWLSRVMFPMAMLLAISFLIPITPSVVPLQFVLVLLVFSTTLIVTFSLQSFVLVFVTTAVTTTIIGGVSIVLLTMDDATCNAIFLIAAGMLLAISGLQCHFWLGGRLGLGKKLIFGLMFCGIMVSSVLMVRTYRLEMAQVTADRWKSRFVAHEAKDWKLQTAPREVRRLTTHTPADLTESELLEIADWWLSDPVSASVTSSWYANEQQAFLNLLRSEKQMSDPLSQFRILRARQVSDLLNRSTKEFSQSTSDCVTWISDPNRTEKELLQAIAFLESTIPGQVVRGLEQSIWNTTGDLISADAVSAPLRFIPWEIKRQNELLRGLVLPTATVSAVDGMKGADQRFSPVLLNYANDQASQWLKLPWYGFNFEVGQTLSLINFDRYLTIRMAMEIYHLRKGQYPSELSQLVPNILEKLPVTVVGRGFYYHPSSSDARVIELTHEDAVAIEGPLLIPFAITTRSITSEEEIAALTKANWFYPAIRASLMQPILNELKESPLLFYQPDFTAFVRYDRTLSSDQWKLPRDRTD